MLTRTLAASVLPRESRLRSALPSLGRLYLRVALARRHSLAVHRRVEAHRARHAARHRQGLR